MSRLIPLFARLPIPISYRWRLLRLAGLDTDTAGIAPGVQFWNTKVKLAAGCFVNRGVKFEGAAQIDVGSHAAIGPDVLILTSTHDIGPSSWRAGAGAPLYAPVSIGAGVWIGARATILPGVTIGDGCVIAANAVVRGDCPRDTMWAGVPARLVKALI
ncbi:acyltransferase [Curtobacterium sp. C1]|uniref:acyltransferase n=1 Tax=Curtobacterium sp. C1 TaxID=2898151 RepID=UPI002ED9B07E